jgi:F0F1-type ATP synthase assembly protein I
VQVWQQFARISGVAIQVFAAVFFGIGAGYLLDRLVPAITPVGVLVGAAAGFGAAIYLMVTGMRAYINAESGGQSKTVDIRTAARRANTEAETKEE